MRPRLLRLDDDLLFLERFDDAEQALKDAVFERLQSRCEYDPLTQCVIYTGAWEPNGQAKVRVGGRVHCLCRVAAWLYFPRFQLWGANRAVRICDSPACWNDAHLRILPDQQSAMAEQRRRGRLGCSCHKLTRRKVESARLDFAAGIPKEVIARGLGVSVSAIRAVILRRTWKECAA